MKRQTWRKCLQSIYLKKELISRIHKELLKLNNQKKGRKKKVAKYADTSSKKTHRWQLSTVKDVQRHELCGKIQMKSTVRNHLHLTERLKLMPDKLMTSQALGDYGETGTLTHHCWERKMGKPLWKNNCLAVSYNVTRMVG